MAAACGSSGASPSSSTTSPASGGNTPTSAATAALVKAATVAKVGKVLVDSKGYTLYYYTKDPKNKDACTGSCAALWHPLTATSASEKISSHSGFGTIHDPGGVLQVTYQGKPLFTYTGDTKPGEAKGEGLLGTWWVVKTTSSSSSSGGGYGAGGSGGW